uniref:Ovule protein n=1 Tax=Caenorhabditis tropicalis TaxID=1561998 RepID=A0A1I7U0W3_9PELO
MKQVGEKQEEKVTIVVQGFSTENFVSTSSETVGPVKIRMILILVEAICKTIHFLVFVQLKSSDEAAQMEKN